MTLLLPRPPAKWLVHVAVVALAEKLVHADIAYTLNITYVRNCPKRPIASKREVESDMLWRVYPTPCHKPDGRRMESAHSLVAWCGPHWTAPSSFLAHNSRRCLFTPWDVVLVR